MDTEDVVRGWLDAARDGDLDRLVTLNNPDLVYRNWALPTIRGAEHLRRAFSLLQRGGVAFDYVIHRIVISDGQAMTERHDMIGFGRFRVVFWVCGVHEVRDGQVTLWHDRYDLLDLGRGMVRGLLGLVLSPARLPAAP